MGTQSAPTTRRLVSLDDAATYLSVNPRTVRRMIAAGELTGFRVGTKIVRVDLNQLAALPRPIPTTGAAI